MPFPNISSDLAINTHMYICTNVKQKEIHLVKCQTLKPYMIAKIIMKHYWDELPDPKRNPFQHATRIDCDKNFVTYNVEYDTQLRTTNRPDVCEDTMNHIIIELNLDGFTTIQVNESDLLKLNSLITKI